jgi:hypothetical protein
LESGFSFWIVIVLPENSTIAISHILNKGIVVSNIDGYIKLNRKSEELFESDPDAFLLMSQIMFRALRKDSPYNKHKLIPGQSLIGDYKNCGLSRQRYRDAQERIEKRYKLATFKGTNKGTIATILNLEFCDINIEDNNQQNNQQRTNKEPTENQQGTTKEEVKKERKKEGKKNKYIRSNFSSSELVEFPFAPHVWFPKEDYEILISEIKEFYVVYHIKQINAYIEAGEGEPYKCYSRAIRTWHENAIKWGTLPKGANSETTKPSTIESIEPPKFRARNILDGK